MAQIGRSSSRRPQLIPHPEKKKKKVSHLVLIFHDLRTARIDPSRQGVMDEICLPLWGAFTTQIMQNPSKCNLLFIHPIDPDSLRGEDAYSLVWAEPYPLPAYPRRGGAMLTF